MRKKIAPFLIQNFIIPSTLLLVYSLVFTWLSTLLLKNDYIELNVNLAFLITLSIFSTILWFVALFFFIVFLPISRPVTSITTSRTLRPAHYLLIALFSLSSVIRYLVVNHEIVSMFDIFMVLAIFLMPIIVVVVIIPYLLSKYTPDRLLLSLANAFAFTLLNMATASQYFKWSNGDGEFAIQLGLFALVGILTLLLLQLKVNDLAFVIMAFIVGSSIIQMLPRNSGQEIQSEVVSTESNSLELALSTEPADTPNIYLLIYDSYVPNETMMNYGINNEEQERYLLEQGFTLYPNTYSIGYNSLSTMNAVLNFSSEANGHRTGVDGNGRVQQILRSLDYQTSGIFGNDWFFLGLEEEPQYDFYTPQAEIFPAYQMLSTAISVGEFRFDIAIQGLPQDEYASLKLETLENIPESPLFVYTHSMLPGHTNRFVCQPNIFDWFGERLERANEEMTEDLETILSNDINSIIIVAGDHGPYLNQGCAINNNQDANRIELQDIHATFLAIRWPSDDYHQFDDITVLQDIFPAIFAWMYRDASILDERVSPFTLPDHYVGRGEVRDGVIIGTVNGGEALFLSGGSQ